MARMIMDLQRKVEQKDTMARSVLEQELVNLAKGSKSSWDTKQPKKPVRGKSGPRNLQTNKVEHLLEIIDHYKAKLLASDEEVSNLKRQKYLL